MKKLFLSVLLILLYTSTVFGAGSITVFDDTSTMIKGVRTITLICVADSSDGSYPETTIHSGLSGIKGTLIGWKLHKVHTDGDHAVIHDGSSNAAVLSDTDAGFDNNQWVDYTITNTTDSSSGTVTANTKTTVTATLAGGTDNDWDAADAGVVGTEPKENSDLYIYMNGSDILDGNGVDQIDNTTERDVYPAIDGQASDIKITDDLVIYIFQPATATNSAVILIKLELWE